MQTMRTQTERIQSQTVPRGIKKGVAVSSVLQGFILSPWDAMIHTVTIMGSAQQILTSTGRRSEQGRGLAMLEQKLRDHLPAEKVIFTGLFGIWLALMGALLAANAGCHALSSVSETHSSRN